MGAGGAPTPTIIVTPPPIVSTGIGVTIPSATPIPTAALSTPTAVPAVPGANPNAQFAAFGTIPTLTVSTTAVIPYRLTGYASGQMAFVTGGVIVSAVEIVSGSNNAYITCPANPAAYNLIIIGNARSVLENVAGDGFVIVGKPSATLASITVTVQAVTPTPSPSTPIPCVSVAPSASFGTIPQLVASTAVSIPYTLTGISSAILAFWNGSSIVGTSVTITTGNTSAVLTCPATAGIYALIIIGPNNTILANQNVSVVLQPTPTPSPSITTVPVATATISTPIPVLYAGLQALISYTLVGVPTALLEYWNGSTVVGTPVTISAGVGQQVGGTSLILNPPTPGSYTLLIVGPNNAILAQTPVTVVPAPTPTPTPTPSASVTTETTSGTLLTNVGTNSPGTITDALGNVYAIVGLHIVINGVSDATTTALAIGYLNHVVYYTDPIANWFKRVNNAWVLYVGPPANPFATPTPSPTVTPTPTPTISAAFGVIPTLSASLTALIPYTLTNANNATMQFWNGSAVVGNPVLITASGSPATIAVPALIGSYTLQIIGGATNIVLAGQTVTVVSPPTPTPSTPTPTPTISVTPSPTPTITAVFGPLPPFYVGTAALVTFTLTNATNATLAFWNGSVIVGNAVLISAATGSANIVAPASVGAYSIVIFGPGNIQLANTPVTVGPVPTPPISTVIVTPPPPTTVVAGPAIIVAGIGTQAVNTPYVVSAQLFGYASIPTNLQYNNNPAQPLNLTPIAQAPGGVQTLSTTQVVIGLSNSVAGPSQFYLKDVSSGLQSNTILYTIAATPTPSPTTLTPTPSPSIIITPSPTVTAPATLGPFLPPALPLLPWHLTARPWTALNMLKGDVLTQVKAGVAFWAANIVNNQIVNPIADSLTSGTGSATPRWVKAAATCINSGDVTFLTLATTCMTQAVADYAAGTNGAASGPELYLPPLVQALALFEASGRITASTITTWRNGLNTTKITASNSNPAPHWSTYASKGAWLQQKDTLISTGTATTFIETQWTGGQIARMTNSAWNLWEDVVASATPDSLAFELVGRVNLLSLAHQSYNGSSAAGNNGILTTTERGATVLGLLQGSAGSAANGGSTSDHVWEDTLQALSHSLMCELTTDTFISGQYRHAALMALTHSATWSRGDGSYQVTKNWFNPTERVGYQSGSSFAGANMMRLAALSEIYDYWTKTSVVEQPAISEIGGYALSLDADFGVSFANAGGTQIEVGTNGDTQQIAGGYWSPIGIRRISRYGWDGRLGPADGRYDGSTGVSFCPTWNAAGTWQVMASLPGNYTGVFTTSLATPVLTICRVVWTSTSSTQPTFQQNLIITPDGVFSDLSMTAANGIAQFGVIFPLIADDGDLSPNRTVFTQNFAPRLATVSGGLASSDDQNWILVNTNGAAVTVVDQVLGSRGHISRVRATASDAHLYTFTYPRNTLDPTAVSVRDSLVVQPNGYTSNIGNVAGSVYAGRTSAGGFGNSLTLLTSTLPDVTFSAPCNFICQVSNGSITRIEADASVVATFRVQLPATLNLAPYVAATVNPAPIVTPTITPSVTVIGESQNGYDVFKSGATPSLPVIDSNSDKWTLQQTPTGGNTVARNNVQDPTISSAIELAYVNRIVFYKDSSLNWSSWSGTAWVARGGTNTTPIFDPFTFYGVARILGVTPTPITITPTITVVPTLVTWSTTDKTAGWTLDSSGRTATSDASALGSIRSTRSVPAGAKVYLEITWTNPALSGTFGVGISTNAYPIGDINGILGNDLGDMNVTLSGNVWSNNIKQGNIGSMTSGAVVGIALDTVNNSVYFRNGLGQWNGSSAANPTTATGGFSIAGFQGLPGIFAACGASAAGYNFRLNGGTGGFVNTAPSGFTSFDTFVVAPPPMAITVNNPGPQLTT